MSIFDFDGGQSSGRGWNYAFPDKEGYQPAITGDVVQISEVQSNNFTTKQPECWPDGKPKLNICMTMLQADGTEVDWTFGPGGRGDRASMAMKAVRAALKNAGFPGATLTEIAGCNITVATQPGFYNSANPRPWGVQINGRGTNEYRGTKKFEPQSQAQQAPQQQQQAPQQAPQQAQVAQQMAQAQMLQKQIMGQAATPQYQQPVQQQAPAPQYQPEPEYQAYEDYYPVDQKF